MRIVGLAVLTLVAGLGVLLAPVTVDDPVVRWPRAGHAPTSTVLPLSPYRPLALDATVPCSALQALARTGGGTALRTMPADLAVPDYPGLLVRVRADAVRITASGRQVLAEPVPAGNECAYRVSADAAGGLVVTPPGGPPVTLPALAVPQVAELATAVAPGPARGLTVELHTDARYESEPTALKLVLLGIHLAALTGLLVLVCRAWRGSGPGLARPRWGWVDAVLVGVSLVWVLLAPMNFDDSWYLLMARGAVDSGAVGNAVYMFNVAENPFVAAQYVMAAWGALGGWGLLWMRVLPLIYGLVTWVLLRVLLATLLGSRPGRQVRADGRTVELRSDGRTVELPSAPWLLLLAHLLWWLPYGVTLRPEPLIVALSAGVLVLAELARRRRSVGVLAVATAVAALALTVSTSGLVALAPLLVALPWLWRWLRAAAPATRVAAVVTLVAAGTALIPVAFADATLGNVAESVAVRQHYYTGYAWYEEYQHYKTLLLLIDSSAWARRAPVLLTLAVLGVAAIGWVRRGLTGDPVRRLLGPWAVIAALALALLAFTPTKWVNHFGAAAAACTVLLALALLRSALPRRAGPVAAAGGVALLVGAVALTYAGPNLWRPYSDRGQPFGNHLVVEGAQLGDPLAVMTSPQIMNLAPHFGPVFLRNPLIWAGVAGVVLLVAVRRRRRGRLTRLAPDRGVLLVGSASLVALLVGVFVAAPIRQYPGWTVALSNVNALTGDRCGLSSHVEVLLGDGRQPKRLSGVAARSGAFATDTPSPVPPPVPGSPVWHSAADGPRTGSLVTPWYALPDSPATHLLVPVLGAEMADQRVRLQYTYSTGSDRVVAGTVPVPVLPTVREGHRGPTPVRQVAADSWQPGTLRLESLGPRRPEAVRVLVTDRIATDGAWVAVSRPRLASWRAVTELTRGRLVYADQVSAALWPCVDQVTVEHGIAQAPTVRLLGAEGFPRDFLELAFEVARGGTQVQATRMGTAVRVRSRLSPSGPPALPWGRVQRVVYDHPVGLVDIEVREDWRWGWEQLPSLSDPDYAARPVYGQVPCR